MASFLLFLLAFCLSSTVSAKTVELFWNLTWVEANPAGLETRKVIGINDTWPLPVVDVDKGDQIVAHVYNGLGDKSASVHWHGMYQNTTSNMDGANMVSQCPIIAGESMTYNFSVNQNGTYWYHCHVEYCYPDGYRQALIVHDPDAYFADNFTDEFTVTLSDWYDELVEDIEPSFISVYNPTGAEPLPSAFLFNDTTNVSIPVTAGETYMLRLINIGAFVGQYFYIEGLNFTIVEVDGVYTQPTEAEMIYLGIAQRYAILFTIPEGTTKNLKMVTVADSVLLDVVKDNLKLNLTNWLEVDASAAHDEAVVTVNIIDSNPAYDDFKLVPYDMTPLYENPTKSITLELSMGLLDNGLPYAFFNDLTYTAPKVPIIYTGLSAGDLADDVTVYGSNTNSFVLDHLDVVEIVINNDDGGTHPLHLHGHNFQVVTRYPSYGPDWYLYENDANGLVFDASNASYPEYPIRRDTMVIPPMGYMVIRFVADNPGVWLFHCHIDWHLAQGLATIMIEAPLVMQQTTTIPDDQYAACAAAAVPTTGNAAGNTEDYLDLSGQKVQAGWLPAGFTTRGIVAIVFSAISACLGMATLTLYGLSDAKFVETADHRVVPATEVVEEEEEATE